MRKASLAAGLTLLVMLAVVAIAAGTNGGGDFSGTSGPDYPAQPRYDPPVEFDDGLAADDPTTFAATATSEPAFSGPEEEALSRLQDLNQQDLPTVSLDGRYVAQLASKTVGIVDPGQIAANGSRAFYAQDILAEHLRLREMFTGEARVVLLLSTDYGRQQLHDGQPLWITFALLPGSTSKEAAARWCVGQYPRVPWAWKSVRPAPLASARLRLG